MGQPIRIFEYTRKPICWHNGEYRLVTVITVKKCWIHVFAPDVDRTRQFSCELQQLPTTIITGNKGGLILWIKDKPYPFGGLTLGGLEV